jgi:hypothetical protein
MKKVILFLALLTCPLLAVAQKGISYQAIILDPNPIKIPGQDITGQPFVNGAVSLKFRIYSANLIQEFEEVHTTQTDAYGMVNVMIGSQNTGAFSNLVWDSNQKNLHVLLSFDQGGTYTKISEQQLTYNPMALFAETASKLSETLSIAGEVRVQRRPQLHVPTWVWAMWTTPRMQRSQSPVQRKQPWTPKPMRMK